MINKSKKYQKLNFNDKIDLLNYEEIKNKK